MTLLLGAVLAVQIQVVASTPAPAPATHAPTATSVEATRTAEPPVLDGRDADVIWQSALARGGRPSSGEP